jgi:putative membrane protein
MNLKNIVQLVSFFSLLFLFSCSPKNLSYEEAIERNNEKLDSDGLKEDARFLVDARDYSQLFLDLASTAREKGYARIVTDFAAELVTDHQRMNQQVQELAKDKKIKLPASLSSRHQNYLNEVTNSDKRAFDKTYLNTIEVLHEKAIRLFEEQALEANSAEIRAFAAGQLDMIRKHERKADDLENELL